jgi:SAM-dependent methyltransferase
MENLQNCPVCNGTSFKDRIKCKDYTVSGNTFNIQECTSCGFLFTNPRPSKEEIGPYYESKDYISHTNSKAGLFNTIYQTIRNVAISQKISMIRTVTGRKTVELLDVGCGTGEFLAGCTKEGWKVKGVEPGEGARSQAIKNHKLEVEEESYLEKTTDTYDVITLWHVLEHVHELNERIEQLSRILRKDGILVIAVPNHTSKDAQVYGPHWAAWDVPRHLYHFSPVTIKRLFQKHGFSHSASFPMKFDAYYVSMLSAGYKRGGKRSLSGLITGMASNLAAKNAEVYSSVIYVFRHAR